MCGRYALTSSPEEIAARFDLQWVPDYIPRYNIAPSQSVPAIRGSAQGREMVMLRWGLIPSWAKDARIGSRLINARAETVMSKPSFRAAYRRRRCLIPADAFYEWQGDSGRKQPYCIRMQDHSVFAMAGLWEYWNDQEGGGVQTSTIITTEANQTVSAIHSRMPVIVSPEDYSNWLLADSADVAALLKPYDSTAMTAYPVSTRVNNVINDDAQCFTPLVG